MPEVGKYRGLFELRYVMYLGTSKGEKNGPFDDAQLFCDQVEQYAAENSFLEEFWNDQDVDATDEYRIVLTLAYQDGEWSEYCVWYPAFLDTEDVSEYWAYSVDQAASRLAYEFNRLAWAQSERPEFIEGSVRDIHTCYVGLCTLLSFGSRVLAVPSPSRNFEEWFAQFPPDKVGKQDCDLDFLRHLFKEVGICSTS